MPEREEYKPGEESHKLKRTQSSSSSAISGAGIDLPGLGGLRSLLESITACMQYFDSKSTTVPFHATSFEPTINALIHEDTRDTLLAINDFYFGQACKNLSEHEEKHEEESNPIPETEQINAWAEQLFGNDARCNAAKVKFIAELNRPLENSNAGLANKLASVFNLFLLEKPLILSNTSASTTDERSLLDACRGMKPKYQDHMKGLLRLCERIAMYAYTRPKNIHQLNAARQAKQKRTNKAYKAASFEEELHLSPPQLLLLLTTLQHEKHGSGNSQPAIQPTIDNAVTALHTISKRMAQSIYNEEKNELIEQNDQLKASLEEESAKNEGLLDIITEEAQASRKLRTENMALRKSVMKATEQITTLSKQAIDTNQQVKIIANRKDEEIADAERRIAEAEARAAEAERRVTEAEAKARVAEERIVTIEQRVANKVAAAEACVAEVGVKLHAVQDRAESAERRAASAESEITKGTQLYAKKLLKRYRLHLACSQLNTLVKSTLTCKRIQGNLIGIASMLDMNDLQTTLTEAPSMSLEALSECISKIQSKLTGSLSKSIQPLVDDIKNGIDKFSQEIAELSQNKSNHTDRSIPSTSGAAAASAGARAGSGR